MPAPIVYQGVVAQDGGGGVLFQGLKFWVAHRIPNRSTYVNDIENNGGKVVPLEKNADYLIADHTRKDAPPGSYSYRLIQSALDQGSLDGADEYLCNASVARPAANAAASVSADDSTRPVSAHAKGTRTPFTQKDDELLAKYITKIERRGGSILGNEVYKAFEAKYPNHTWQSWRDRWVKRLGHLPRPDVSDGEPDLSHPPPTSSRGRNPSSNGTGGPRSRAMFTAEEDNLLWQCIQEAVQEGRHLRGNEIYKELACDFPQHTYQSWRDRALKFVIPQHQEEIKRLRSLKLAAHGEQAREKDTRNPKEPLAKQQASRTQEATSAKRTVLQDAQPNSSPAPQAFKEAPMNADDPRSPSERLSKYTPQKLPHLSPKAQVESEPHVEDHPREPTDASSSSPETHPAELQNNEFLAPKRLEVGLKSQFYRDYTSFLEAEGIQAIPWPSIRGRAIELWDLWKAVISQKVDPAERDWQQVAEDMGFNWIEDEAAPEEIRVCYERNLSDFEEAMLSFEQFGEDDDEDDDDGENEEDEEDEGEEGEEEEEVEEPMPSSLPVLSSLKRPFEATSLSSDPAYPHSSPKRRRLDRNQEVPSTPDELSGISRLRYRTNGQVTPTKLASTPRERLSASRNQMQLIATNEEEEDELRDDVQELPVLPPPRLQAVEPETQDFQFDPETQKFVNNEILEEMEEETQDNITPSQQLRLESDATIPDLLAIAPSSQHSREKSMQNNTPTPRPKIKNPFREDDSDEATPRTIKARGKSSPLAKSSPERQRRSLPKSWGQDTVTAAHSTKLSTPQRRQRQQSTTPTSPIPQRARKSPPKVTEARTATPVKESPNDIIDRFLALGYTKAIVVRALKATTWHIGNAGQVMEILRRGEELPQRTSGVWTQRDDDALLLVDSKVPPKDAKEEKKRGKELRRLKAKHGDQGIEARRQYLNA
ncbi:TRF2-interacting telomeric protein/Rap1 C terminal domain-containing protein [Biscogniauxia mediterranea]|nr:TRF2-interacting telomeric protein/Rap1 C terminal domain-containing protein [Biscogniauxia mediterranea]